MGRRAPGVALWALVILLLVGGLATIAGARAGPSNYTLSGYVEQAGGLLPVPAGVSVDLISSASHQVYSVKTSSASGSFTFHSSDTGGALGPGWWGFYVPPQANVPLPLSSGCSPCTILPLSPNPQYYYENVTSLTTGGTSTNPVTITGVQAIPDNATVYGNVTFGGSPYGGAQVELLAPTFSNFVVQNNTTATLKTNTTAVGQFTLKAPYGNWVLETIVPGSPNKFAMQQLNISSTHVSLAPIAVKSYFLYGWVNQASLPNAHVPAGGNATLYDLSTKYVYQSTMSAGGYYNFATYPGGFTGPGAQTFDVVLSPVGWKTTSYLLTISPAQPSGAGGNPHISLTSATAPPAAYLTTLNFSRGFGLVTVHTTANLGNDSVFPELANASVGQLWAQLALDWQHNTSFLSSNLNHVLGWINQSGPFFPAGQSQLQVNANGTSAVSFTQPTNYTFTNATTCAGVCGLSNAGNLTLNWGQTYVANGTVTSGAKSYTVAFTFRHPTWGQSINYTVVLPTGYVLSAGSASNAPTKTQLVPAGPGNTWTSFKLVSQPYTSPSATATFTIVKYGSANVTATVNASVSNFAFSKKNVLNQTHNHYTAIVGMGENVTFSALNSTFPAGTNGTYYQWNFGDGHFTNTSQATTYHTYQSSTEFTGSLTVTSSSGLKGSATFFVLSGATPPTAVISSNATTVLTSGGVNYTIINWSQTLHFNASKSSSIVYPSAPNPGVISIANWNISTGTKAVTGFPANLTAGSGANTSSNEPYTFLGAGAYLTSALVGGQPVAFTGWQYNVTLTVFDGGGHKATSLFVVLVRDKEKPVPVATILNSAGKVISSAGVVEGPNHLATVQLSQANSTDPHNGSIVWYNWTLTNKANSSVNLTYPIAALAGFKIPPAKTITLAPQSKPYTVNLTVTDRAGNKAWTVVSLTVAVNTTTRPVLAVGNLTAPGTLTDGSKYTVWVNVTNTLGKNSTAQNLTVLFYLLPPSGTGTPIAIGGSPSSVQFYNYTNGAVNTVAFATGKATLKYNETVRAVITWTPARTGTFALWANATATNEFTADYASGGNQAHVTVTLNQNPIVQYEEYGAIAAAVVAVIVVLYLVYRRRTGAPKSSGKSSGGSRLLERPGKKDEVEEEDDDES